MALQPFTNEQLNYFKFAFVVLNEFPKVLRQTFKQMWDNNFAHLSGYQPWDDSVAVRNMFLATEGGKTKVPTHLSYEEWDCTTLFQATIHAQSFTLPDRVGHYRTLSDLYLRYRKPPRGNFHSYVVSPGGNTAETFALAIDQLRLLRNAFCHSFSSEIDKKTFDQYIQHTKDAIKALGSNTDPIDAVGSLTESDFPTSRVCKLEDDIKKELQTERAFLKDDVRHELKAIKSDIAQLKQERTEDAKFLKKEFISHKEELKENTSELRKAIETTTAVNQEVMSEKIAEINQKLEALFKAERSGSKTFLPRSNLPPMVPLFTGRQAECDEIVGLLTSEATRLVSVWGSPGFGKTSVAIAVGHHLQARELPVYFLSLRGLKSKSDLTSKCLSLFREAGTLAPNEVQSLSADDELCLIFYRLWNRCVIILDNANDLFECGVPNVKEEVINLIEEILKRNNKINFLLTTRESLSFLNLHFQGHMSVRIRELDKFSCQTLARELLPEANSFDLTKVSKICGQIPLAIKLLCSTISEDFARSNEYIDEFMECTENIVEMLDNPDYPSKLRLKSLFETSFQRLSSQDQQALVSLCILPANFYLKIAAAVLGITRTTEAEKVLRRLQRKSLIDCCSNFGRFSMHKLIQSFARGKGETDMKETVLISKSRFHTFYIALLEKLNANFLTGRSMFAFIEFYEDETNIVQSLIDGCFNPKTAERVFDALTKAELFLDSLFWSDGSKFEKIFDSALLAAHQSGKTVFYRRLLTSKAFTYVTWAESENTKKLLSESKEFQVSTYSDGEEEQGKHLCYYGLYQLITGKIEDGVKVLEEAVSSMNASPEHTILRLIIFQIFAIYYQYKNDSMRSHNFYMRALKECGDAGDTGLLVIPMLPSAIRTGVEHCFIWSGNTLVNQPLKFQVILLVSEAVKTFSTSDTKQFFGNWLRGILHECKSALHTSTLGWSVNFHRNVVALLQSLCRDEEAMTITKERIGIHQQALQQSLERNEKIDDNSEHQEEALAQNYSDLGDIQYGRGNYAEALTSFQRAVRIRLKLFGEKHLQTADCYHGIGVTQHSLGDYTSALESKKRALDIRIKLLGEAHPKTADSHREVGVSQYLLRDYTSALESLKRALDIRIKLSGEVHSKTADSYHEVGVTQHAQGDYMSALESKQSALVIRLKLFGEEHSKTADSYHSIGVTQHILADYTSALESHKRALDIRIKMFGEEHPKTADSYRSVSYLKSLTLSVKLP